MQQKVTLEQVKARLIKNGFEKTDVEYPLHHMYKKGREFFMLPKTTEFPCYDDYMEFIIKEIDHVLYPN